VNNPFLRHTAPTVRIVSDGMYVNGLTAKLPRSQPAAPNRGDRTLRSSRRGVREADSVVAKSN